MTGVQTCALPIYAFVFVKGKLAIGKTLLTIKANDVQRSYGQPDPEFSYTLNGFVNGQSLGNSGISGSPEVGSGTSEYTSAGIYDIIADQGTMFSDNYDFAFVNGKLTINKAVLNVKVNDASRTYGSANPDFTYSLSGFVNGESLEAIGLEQFLEQFTVNEEMINALVAVGERSKVKADRQDLIRNRKLFEVHLKAQVGRKICKNDGFYPVINTLNEALWKGVELLEKSPAPDGEKM